MLCIKLFILQSGQVTPGFRHKICGQEYSLTISVFIGYNIVIFKRNRQAFLALTNEETLLIIINKQSLEYSRYKHYNILIIV